MADTKYSDYLKDARWVNKRKRIIYRDGNKCTVCQSKKALQVHHTFYYTDYREPWRYPDESLLTLCKACHQKYHEEHEHEYKEPPKLFVKKKRLKHIRKNKKRNGKKDFHGFRDRKPSLLSMQAKRLGYINDGLGHWVKLK